MLHTRSCGAAASRGRESWLEAGGEYEEGGASLVVGVGWDLDEMKQFRVGGADVEVVIW